MQWDHCDLGSVVLTPELSHKFLFREERKKNMRNKDVEDFQIESEEKRENLVKKRNYLKT